MLLGRQREEWGQNNNMQVPKGGRCTWGVWIGTLSSRMPVIAYLTYVNG